MRSDFLNRMNDEQRQLVQDFVRRPDAALEELAAALGIKVIYKDLGTDCEGLYEYDPGTNPETGKVVYVHSGMPAFKKRATLAHEIGHCVLGHDDWYIHHDEGLFDDEDSLTEREARQFALELLVDMQALHEAFNLGRRSGECPIFCVSVIWFMLPDRSKDDDDF